MKDRARRWLADAIRAAREQHDFRLIAWVFMPEHVHLLILPRQREYSVSAMLSSIKLPVTIKVRGFVMKNAPGFLAQMLDEQPNGKRAFRFWQRGGGYDRNIYTADELWEKIRYIHRNPLVRKLVARPEGWEWSSAADYARTRVGEPPLPVDNQDLPSTW
jgi:putative transposase